MMRLPPFLYTAPRTAREAAAALNAEGPQAMLVAGGTDLYPNMKRRHQTPTTLVSVRKITEMRGIAWEADGTLTIGAGEALRALERDPGITERQPALWQAVNSISTPLLRNMGSIGGNVCLDTRCNYYNQNLEWRKAINFCMKCEGDTCWVAPSSPRCWAVNSSDSVPALMALDARVHLTGPDGERDLPIDDLFRDDGIEYLTKRKDEVLTHLTVPPANGARAVYRKVRRRGAFDFPVLGVAIRLERDGEADDAPVKDVKIVLNAVGSTPHVATEAMDFLRGKPLTDEVIEEVLPKAWRPAKPLDNTDHAHTWRKKMVKVEVKRALRALA
ncbi:MAG: FAD binding domain-containing protein [Planctomycetota bacterium]|jgi:4-hydroxybenzoyl-CoA reductase subunit beta